MSNRSWEDRADYAETHPVLASLKWGIITIVVVAILLGVIGIISTGSVFFQGAAAKVTNPAQVQKKVYDPNNTIAQVAFFHDTCNGVRTAFAQWQSAQQKLTLDTKASNSSDPIKAQQAQNALTQDTTALVGTQQNIYATANNYNSRSGQYTANVFKDANLPERIAPPVNVGDLNSWSPPTCG